MAKIVVENATVQRTFETQHGFGVSVFETFKKRDQTEAKSYFTLWFKESPDLEQGQVISASGFHSARVRSYEVDGETRHSADVSVNGARLIAAAPPVAQAEAPADVWSAPTGGDF